jgi:hypothetical protein
MSDEQMALFKSESMKEIPAAVLDTKHDYERRKSVLQLIPDSKPTSFLKPPAKASTMQQNPAHPNGTEIQKKRKAIGTRLAMTSRVAFSQDRIITTELMRAMAILYIGPKNKPSFDTDYLLSPVRAPSDLLALFPKTCLMCGEKDPLVDDTIVMAGRIREAKRMARARKRGIAMSSRDESDSDWVEMMLIRGVSHGFLQMTSFLKEGRVAVDFIGTWLEDLFSEEEPAPAKPNDTGVTFSLETGESESSSGEEEPLQLGSSRTHSPALAPADGKVSPPKRRESPSKEKGDKEKNHYRHDTWEKRNVLQEGLLMERRREALTRGLEAPEKEGQTDA